VLKGQGGLLKIKKIKNVPYLADILHSLLETKTFSVQKKIRNDQFIFFIKILGLKARFEQDFRN
jgi:hypothetical protein